MEYVVKAPGSCGELIQGRVSGNSFLVTCPINRFSYVIARSGKLCTVLPPKAEEAMKRTKRYIGVNAEVDLRLFSEVYVGKGMASSSADIAAICMGTALVCGRVLTQKELGMLTVSIEPTDATFFPGIVQWDYHHGNFLYSLGSVNGLYFCIFDEGGEIDTDVFNRRTDLAELRQKQESEMERALHLLTEGILNKNFCQIGRATTISAFANQAILPKVYLEEFYNDAMRLGAVGVTIAHSGTVYAALCTKDKVQQICLKLKKKYQGSLRFLDAVEFYGQGISFTVRG